MLTFFYAGDEFFGGETATGFDAEGGQRANNALISGNDFFNDLGASYPDIPLTDSQEEDVSEGAGLSEGFNGSATAGNSAPKYNGYTVNFLGFCKKRTHIFKWSIFLQHRCL